MFEIPSLHCSCKHSKETSFSHRDNFINSISEFQWKSRVRKRKYAKTDFPPRRHLLCSNLCFKLKVKSFFTFSLLYFALYCNHFCLEPYILLPCSITALHFSMAYSRDSRKQQKAKSRIYAQSCRIKDLEYALLFQIHFLVRNVTHFNNQHFMAL